MRLVRWLVRWLTNPCSLGFHEGEIVGHGRIEVTGKKNLPGRLPIDGWWLVRKCGFCGESFSYPSDRFGLPETGRIG